MEMIDVGAIDYCVEIYEIDVKRAYREALGEARGSSPYSGTIAESDGYEVVESTPVDSETAYELAWDLLEEDERFRRKNGPAGAIALLGSRRSITAEIPDKLEGYPSFEEAEAAALSGLLKDGERILSHETTVRYEMTAPRYPNDSGRPRGGRVTVRVEGGQVQHAGLLFFGTASW
jgi:hypothetical protein